MLEFSIRKILSKKDFEFKANLDCDSGCNPPGNS